MSCSNSVLETNAQDLVWLKANTKIKDSASLTDTLIPKTWLPVCHSLSLYHTPTQCVRASASHCLNSLTQFCPMKAR